MAGLLIKDLSDDLHQKLKARAAANRRSLAKEVLTILQTALSERPRPLTLSEIDRFRAHGLQPLTDELLESARKRDR